MLLNHMLYHGELRRCSILKSVLPTRSTRWAFVRRLLDAKGRRLGSVRVWLDSDPADPPNQLDIDVKGHAATGVYKRHW